MKPTGKSAATAPDSIAVVLNKPHEHAGKQNPAGASINVTASEREWLERQAIIGDKQESNQ